MISNSYANCTEEGDDGKYSVAHLSIPDTMYYHILDLFFSVKSLVD